MKYITGEYYHVYNRGTDKRKVFQTKQDYTRFLNSLNVFNTFDRVDHTNRILSNSGLERISTNLDSIVEVVDYCLMPNHFHLILKQLKDDGISKFTQKVSIAHTQYFNLKYDRSGVLFQGRTKAKHVNSQEYYQYLIDYVYFNPIDLIESGWKENGIRDINKVIDFLDNYRWTSGKNHVRFKDQLVA